MAWSNEDKISYNELNPALQAMIDSKVDVDNYRSFAQEYQAHKQNYVLHIQIEEREAWNYAYKRVKEMLDTDIGENIAKMGEINTNLDAHKADMVTHWSIEARNEYNNFVVNTKNNFENIRNQINEVDKKFDNYSEIKTVAEVSTNLTNHVLNKIGHITQTERDRWNKILETAQETATSDLKAHKLDEEVHLIGGERANWNSHIEDKTLHITPAEKVDMQIHMENKNIHVTAALKEKWDDTINKYIALETRVRLLETEVASLQRTIANILARM